MRDKLASIYIIFFYAVVILAILYLVYDNNQLKYSFSVEEKYITMALGDSYDINLYTIDDKYKEASNYDMIYDSDTLDIDGYTIHAKNVGESKIIIRSKKGKDKKEIQVKVVNDKIKSIVAQDLKMRINDDSKINVVFNNDETLKSNVKFESSDSFVAKVDEKGNVTAVNEGTATIKVSYSDDVYTYVEVNVNENIEQQNNNQESKNNQESSNNQEQNINQNENNQQNSNQQLNNKVVYILKDTSFSRGFELVNNSGDNGSAVTYRSCDNDSGTGCDPYFYLYNANNYPNMTKFYTDSNGYRTITAEQTDGTNDKLFRYKDGEIQMQVNTFGKTYPAEGNTWPHLLITGATSKPNGLSTLGPFNAYVPADEKSYYYLSNDNQITFEVDVKLDFMEKGNPINDVLAAQIVAYLEIYDDVNNQMYWLGFNLFDDRGVCYNIDQGYFNMDDQTSSYNLLLPSVSIYENEATIYNGGNIVYNDWRHVKVSITEKINELIYQLNLAGINVDRNKLRIGGFNMGYEIHGEYWIGASFKNLSLVSTKK